MNKKINLTAIDTQITPIIHAVQYDTDRYLDCYFEDIDITGVSSARIYAKKPDGTEVYNDCVIQNGYITAPLTSQTLAVVGKVNCQLQLVIDGTLTSFAFTVIVDESLVSSSAIPSSNEYTALESLIAEAESVIDGLPTKVSKSGDSMSGTLDMTDNKIVNLGTPTADADAANKEYVDDAISSIPVDSALSDTSENPVQNKVVKSAIDGKVNKGTESNGGDAIGAGTTASAIRSAAIGSNANAQSSSAIAIGNGAIAQATGAIQIGFGTNNNPNTVQFIGYQLLGSSGKIPDARLNFMPSAFELLANKVITISSASTDTEYPSAKCVYDAIDAVPVITVDSSLDAQSVNPVENGVIVTALGGKESTTNKVTAFSSPTDTEYPSAKLVDDNLALKEDVANKVTSISAASTDTEYPSAKCMYDLIGDINTILANLATP